MLVEDRARPDETPLSIDRSNNGDYLVSVEESGVTPAMINAKTKPMQKQVPAPAHYSE